MAKWAVFNKQKELLGNVHADDSSEALTRANEAYPDEKGMVYVDLISEGDGGRI